MTNVRWLRVSYWVGAIADSITAGLMLSPETGRALYGVSGFEPDANYRYAMRFGAALMIGWVVLLLWADRKPVERRGVLPITVVVLAGLAWAGGYAVDAGLIQLANMVPTWIIEGLLAVLFVYAYFRGGRPRSDLKAEGAISLAEAADEFLAQKRFAVAGVSRSGNAPANAIYEKLVESGRTTYAINPNTTVVGEIVCHASVSALPEPPDAVVIATHPDQAIDVARDCRDARVPFVWFHRSIDGGSLSAEAAELCADYGATVIPGSCPMMHLEPVDLGHRCMHGLLTLTRRLPDSVHSPRS
ncbi:MAG: CoA-binding protein [Myxococcota bacterium]